MPPFSNGHEPSCPFAHTILDTNVESFNNRPAMTARLLVLLSAVCFGTTGTAQALGPDAAPITVGAARIAIGGALRLLVARAVPAAAAPWPRRELGVIAAAISVYQLSFFAAVDRTGVAVGTVVALGSAPAIAGVTARVFDAEPLTSRWAAATALACSGVLLLVLGSGADASV